MAGGSSIFSSEALFRYLLWNAFHFHTFQFFFVTGGHFVIRSRRRFWWRPFLENWGTYFKSTFLLVISLPSLLLGSFHPSFFCSHLSIHTFCLWWWILLRTWNCLILTFRHMWILILWDFSRRISWYGVSCDKRICKRTLRGLGYWHDELWNGHWYYILFNKSIIMTPSIIKSWILHPTFYNLGFMS